MLLLGPRNENSVLNYLLKPNHYATKTKYSKNMYFWLPTYIL